MIDVSVKSTVHDGAVGIVSKDIYAGGRAVRLLVPEEEDEVLNAGLDKIFVMMPTYSGREARSRRWRCNAKS